MTVLQRKDGFGNVEPSNVLIHTAKALKEAAAVSTVAILHDYVQVVLVGEAIVKADNKRVVCDCQDVALVLDIVDHVLSPKLGFSHDLQRSFDLSDC